MLPRHLVAELVGQLEAPAMRVRDDEVPPAHIDLHVRALQDERLDEAGVDRDRGRIGPRARRQGSEEHQDEGPHD